MRYLLIPIRADISNFFQFLKNMSVYSEGERKGGREREYDVWVCVPCHVGRGQDTTSRFSRVSYSLLQWVPRIKLGCQTCTAEEFGY